MSLLRALEPELVLIVVACVLFFLGTSLKASVRRLCALITVITLAVVFVWQGYVFLNTPKDAAPAVDAFNVIHVGSFSLFVKTMVAGVGMVLVLLAWPGNRDATGSGSLNFGGDAGEFFALTLLSLAGVFLVSSANDLILLFLAIELAAIPTYIMVSISRPLPVAQEAGVKYFFLGAMAAAVMLFGFSYVYGGTGLIKFDEIAAMLDKTRDAASNGWGVPNISSWLMLGVTVLLVGFAFKIAAVPFHAYVGDVYQGAATPVTAMLAFIPKTSGFLAILKLMSAIGGAHYAVPTTIGKLVVVVAVLTMTFGNVLGLLQQSVKRVLAYSSIAHSGYMLVAVAALVMASEKMQPGDAATHVQQSAVQGILFYLCTYGLMNAGAFGILMLLPTRAHKLMGDSDLPPVATTAETYEDLAGQGRLHPVLGLGMAICCFSLIGLPLTVGFFGKFYLIRPALQVNGMAWLVAVTMINAAISAAYYLKIIATMFIRPLPEDATQVTPQAWPLPLSLGVGISVLATLVLGIAIPWTDAFSSRLLGASASPVVPAATVQLPAAATPVAQLPPDR